MSVFKKHFGFSPRHLLCLIAGGGVLFLLTGCFLFVSPELPPEKLAESSAGDSRYYRLFGDDDFSCMRLHLPAEKLPHPVPAVVIFPGGAYGVLAIDKEGNEVAEFFNKHGIAAAVVKYPLGSCFGGYRRHPAMVAAARRAVRLLRFHAPRLGIDPGRIGAAGFSAGGHLAGLAAWLPGWCGQPGAADPVERVSARPDFLILAYPVVTLEGDKAHRMSRENLIGTSPAPDLAGALSLQNLAKSGSPPVFLWTTLEDRTVDPENSRMLAGVLEREKIPHRVIFYPRGPHGMGLLTPSQRASYPEAAKWSEELLTFFAEQGIHTAAGGSK